MKRRIKVIFFCMLAVFLLMGCTGERKALKEGERAYNIYYLNNAMTKLAPQEYVTQQTDNNAVLDELMQQFTTVPQDVDVQLALGEKVEYKRLTREGNIVYVYFNDAYSSMKPTREILCRAALTKTLTQVDDVDYVNIYTGEQPLMNAAGSPVGVLSANDFIENITDINSYDKTELTLYFTDEKGEKLIAEKRDVVYNMNTSLERLIIEQLMSGPGIKGHYPTIPPDTKLLNVSVNDKVCYINFNEAFLTGVAEVKDYIPIYSIVNSLSELSTVNKVQISVNGLQDAMFMDSISLNTLFERNIEDYIGGQ